jgi:hypothetical protein
MTGRELSVIQADKSTTGRKESTRQRMNPLHRCHRGCIKRRRQTDKQTPSPKEQLYFGRGT